jgi:toxin FitB
MILLDTNVFSELVRPEPDSAVLEWARIQPLKSLGTSTITLAELTLGVALMPIGKRQRNLENDLNAMVQRAVGARVFGFDVESVKFFAILGARRQRAGLAISTADLMIAAIAAQHNFAVCTRNTADFEECNLVLINPWQ